MGANKTSLCRGRPIKRKCLCCNDFFVPDPRNHRHQHYCFKPTCRHASKMASQRRWLSSSKGSGYFGDPLHVARVQDWRKAHPGYSKRDSSRHPQPLQDFIPVQGIENTAVNDILIQNALQDISFLQPALFIGLIASLTGSTLQDDIAQTTRRFIDSGRDILCNATKPPSL